MALVCKAPKESSAPFHLIFCSSLLGSVVVSCPCNLQKPPKVTSPGILSWSFLSTVVFVSEATEVITGKKLKLTETNEVNQTKYWTVLKKLLQICQYQNYTMESFLLLNGPNS